MYKYNSSSSVECTVKILNNISYFKASHVSVLLYLNLSFNNLVGEVPTDGVFRNASTILVIGNKNLCGGIPELQMQCQSCEARKIPCIQIDSHSC